MVGNGLEMHYGSMPIDVRLFLIDLYMQLLIVQRQTIILTETLIFKHLSFDVGLSQSILTKMTVETMGSFHGFGTKLI